jgi:hypothetical protein
MNIFIYYYYKYAYEYIYASDLSLVDLGEPE